MIMMLVRNKCGAASGSRGYLDGGSLSQIRIVLNAASDSGHMHSSPLLTGLKCGEVTTPGATWSDPDQLLSRVFRSWALPIAHCQHP